MAERKTAAPMGGAKKGAGLLQALDAAALRRAMGDMAPGTAVETADTVDSTSLRLKEAARAGRIRPPYLLIAGRQTAGHGRLGRRFVSPEGGLYMSLLAPAPEDAGPEKITLLAAVAVCRAIEETAGLRPGIKWVNDLFLNGKKVCGILAEGTAAGAVIGIGINLLPPPGGFPPEAGPAGALGVAADRNLLAGRIAAGILRGLKDPDDPAILAAYRERMFLTGRRVRYRFEGKECAGLVLGVADDGGLIVSDEAGERVLRSGEVTLGSQLFSRLE